MYLTLVEIGTSLHVLKVSDATSHASLNSASVDCGT
jgi:hypothetical protein